MAREVENREADADIRSISVINVLLGIWLIVTPFWFGYSSAAARWDQVIIGIAVIVLAGIRALVPGQRWASFLVGLAAIWAIIAPFILSYNRAAAYWNEVIVGIVLAILAFTNSALSNAWDRGRHTQV